MRPMIELAIAILYGFCALLLALYTCGQALLLIQYLRHRQQIPPQPPALNTWPDVAVQLPLYNEQHVAARLLKAVVALDYPAEHLHIQILDDSSDSTTSIIEGILRQYPHLNISHMRRVERTGYKAGALAAGLQQTQAEFVALFDADFIPPPDFLRRTVPYLSVDARLGVLQTRWGHLNATQNCLTRAQVLAVDAHFVIEQQGRYAAGWLLPFNGTGGVWRVATIEDAGGWSDATLTEDLDLSLRAQIKGWRSLFLPDVVVPGELPPQIAAYRQQQVRWAKGSAQCLRRLLLPLWQAELSLGSRLMATQHLFQYMPQPLMLLLLLLTPPLLLTHHWQSLPLAPLGIIGLIPPLMYLISQRDSSAGWRDNLRAFPVLLLIGTGMIWQNTQAIVSGLLGEKGEFHRTPKFAQHGQTSRYALLSQPSMIIEWFWMFYALWAAWLAAQIEVTIMPYLLIYAAAFATVIIWDWLERRHLRRLFLAQPRPLPDSGNE